MKTSKAEKLLRRLNAAYADLAYATMQESWAGAKHLDERAEIRKSHADALRTVVLVRKELAAELKKYREVMK